MGKRLSLLIIFVLTVLLASLSCRNRELGKSQADQAPGGNSPRKPGVTIEDLRKRRPVCGVPSNDRDTFLKRAGALDKQHFSDWMVALARLEATTESGTLFLKLPLKASLLFEGETIKEDVHKRLMKRLASLSPQQFADWVVRFYADLKLADDIPAWSIAVTVAAVDDLYDKSDQYDPQKAAKYLKRLRGLSMGHVLLWQEKVGRTYADDAVFMILLNDDFFQDDCFDEKAFNAVLK